MEFSISVEPKLMTDIIQMLEQFINYHFDDFRALYTAVYYLFKIEIYKFPKEYIIFYILGSYNLSSKVLGFKKEHEIYEIIEDIFNKLQKKEITLNMLDSDMIYIIKKKKIICLNLILQHKTSNIHEEH